MGVNETIEVHGEADARAVLQAIAPRLADAPHALLGVPADAAAPVLRAAFLRLTKQYHPTKYARFAPDVVRLANEVFLTIKRAYDQLNAAASRPAVAIGTGTLPSVRVAGTSPPARAATIPAPGGPPAARPAAPSVSGPPRARVSTPPTGVPRAPTQGPVPPAPAAAPPRPSDGIPRVSFATSAPPTSPSTATPPRARTGSSGPISASAAAPTSADLEAALELLRRKLWTDARQAFHKMAVAAPQDRKARAYMHYARGREAEDAGKPDEARAEWQRAVNLDPDLQVAKRALDDLPTDPPSGGGLLKRLFKK